TLPRASTGLLRDCIPRTDAKKHGRRATVHDETYSYDFLVDQVDVQDRQFEDVRTPPFLDFKEQYGDEFLAHIDFQRIRFLRPRHNADVFIVKFAAQIGMQGRHRLNAGVVADLNDHTKIIRALAVLVV